MTFPHHKIPIKLSHELHKQKLLSKHIFFNQSAPLSKGYKTHFYPQTLDHFNYGPTSDTTFRQKYIINDKNWGGAKNNSPIIAYFGSEGALADQINYITAALNDIAQSLKPLLVFIETHFYLQTLDHFNYGPTSGTTFRQKYVINDKNWGGAKNNSPILAYFGAEGALERQIRSLGSALNDTAHSLKALLVLIEIGERRSDPNRFGD
ncbi:lysosomal Pro-X carboxypeptidase, partial [Striga asiatica]